MKPAKLINMRSNKNRHVPKDKINKIIKLYSELASLKDISEKTEVNYSTVKTIIRREIGNKRPDTEYMIKVRKEVEFDRLTMTKAQVAEKFGKSIRWVTWVTQDSDLRDKFVNARKLRESQGIGKTKRIEIKDRVPTEKGYIKLKPKEIILPTRIPKAQRSVPMYDNKNTIKFVDLDDPRSNEEIRSSWKEEQEKKLRSLAS